MISITENRSFKYILYISIYLTEGIVTLLTVTILPIYLKNYLGLPDLSIAFLAGMAFLPIILKPIIALISDKYALKPLVGKRKPYMIIGFILNGIMIPFLGIINPIDALYLFAIIWLIQSLGISFMDVALDALVVESFPGTKEKLNANIIFQLATIFSIVLVIPIAFLCEKDVIHIGFHLKFVFDYDIFFGGNFGFGFLLTGIICLGLIFTVLLLKESKQKNSKPKFLKDDLIRFIKSENIKILLLVFFLIQIDSGLTEFTLDPFFRILGWTSGVQLLSFSPMVIIYLPGTIASKWFIKRGIIRSMILISIIHAFFYSILSFLTFIRSQFIPLYYFGAGTIASFFTATGTVLLFTLAMNSAKKEMAATTFVILISIMGLGRVFGIIIAGIIPYSDFFKMGIIFLISAIIMIIRIPGFFKIKVLENKNR